MEEDVEFLKKSRLNANNSPSKFSSISKATAKAEIKNSDIEEH